MKVAERVCVVGLGYIGLPTACLLAKRGYRVLGVDINEETLKKVNAGELPIEEPDLDVLLAQMVKEGRISAQKVPATSDIFVIAVPTPFTDGHKPDISYVESAMKAVIPVLEPGNLVILESTSPVGTTQFLRDLTERLRPELFAGATPPLFAYGPERVLPGRILIELQQNDRVVGGTDPVASEAACVFYKTLTSGQVFTTHARTAELTKLTENAFRDVNIAFANELSMICDKMNIDVWELIELANHHPRVDILKPGPGVGGHCIAVDPWFIVDAAPRESTLIQNARRVNLKKTEFVVEKILQSLTRTSASQLAFLGLTYKPDIDDIRESPAVEVLEKVLESWSGTVCVVEPHLKTFPAHLQTHANLKLCSLDEALAQSPVCALLVDHKEFKTLNPGKIKNKTVIDTRGAWRQTSTGRSDRERSRGTDATEAPL